MRLKLELILYLYLKKVAKYSVKTLHNLPFYFYGNKNNKIKLQIYFSFKISI